MSEIIIKKSTKSPAASSKRSLSTESTDSPKKKRLSRIIRPADSSDEDEEEPEEKYSAGLYDSEDSDAEDIETQEDRDFIDDSEAAKQIAIYDSKHMQRGVVVPFNFSSARKLAQVKAQIMVPFAGVDTMEEALEIAGTELLERESKIEFLELTVNAGCKVYEKESELVMSNTTKLSERVKKEMQKYERMLNRRDAKISLLKAEVEALRSKYGSTSQTEKSEIDLTLDSDDESSTDDASYYAATHENSNH